MKITPPYSDDWWDRHYNSPHPHCKDFVLKIKVIVPFTILGFDSSETAGFKTRDSCFRNLVATNELPRQRMSLKVWVFVRYTLFDFLRNAFSKEKIELQKCSFKNILYVGNL